MFFKLSEKQPVVLSKQPIVLYLGVFRKGWKLFLNGWAVKTKTTDWFVETTDCLFLVPQQKTVLCFDWALNVFLTDDAPVFNALTNL